MLPVMRFSVVALMAAAALSVPLTAEEGVQPAVAPEEDGYVRAGRETVVLLHELTEVLNGISDRASADAAVPKVKDISGRMQALRLRAESLPKPDSEQKLRFRKHLGDQEVRTAVQGFMVALLNLAQTEAYGSEDLLNTLTEMVSGKM